MIRFACGFAALVVCVIAFSRSASFLVIDQPAKSDVVLVLNGDWYVRAAKGAQLVRAGLGQNLLIDSDSSVHFGMTTADRARMLISRKFPEIVSRVEVCPTAADSTRSEVADIALCLARLNATSVLVVTSDFHTRRAISILRSALPQYHWSVAAARDENVFRTDWWRDRTSVLTYISEWEKLAWWEAIERWYTVGS